MIRFLVVAVVAICGFGTASYGCETGQSCLPDSDTSGFNNTMERAEDLGPAVDPQGRPRTIVRSDELGVVPTGFDSVDFYKFTLPANLFQVTISTIETPKTSSWIMIYDQSGRKLISDEQGKGRDDESVTLNLRAGTYYVAVMTDRGVANNRNLKYTLTIKPTIVPLPNDGMAACGPSATWQSVDDRAVISGSIAPGTGNTYPVFLSHAAQFVAVRQTFATRYEIAIMDRASGDSILLLPFDSSTPLWTALDPGFYCLRVSAPGQQGPVNFEIAIGAPNMGFPLGNARNNAPCVPNLNLGNLSRNGHYDRVRYPADPNITCFLEGVTQYTLREWIGIQRPEGWLRFDLREARKVEMLVSNLYNPIRVEIQNEAGDIVATTVSTGIPLSDQLPHQTSSSVLAAGRYYIRAIYLGMRPPGTNMQLLVVANPPPAR